MQFCLAQDLNNFIKSTTEIIKISNLLTIILKMLLHANNFNLKNIKYFTESTLNTIK